jgi:hypothetical protein
MVAGRSDDVELTREAMTTPITLLTQVGNEVSFRKLTRTKLDVANDRWKDSIAIVFVVATTPSDKHRSCRSQNSKILRV